MNGEQISKVVQKSHRKWCSGDLHNHHGEYCALGIIAAERSVTDTTLDWYGESGEAHECEKTFKSWPAWDSRL